MINYKAIKTLTLTAEVNTNPTSSNASDRTAITSGEMIKTNFIPTSNKTKEKRPYASVTLLIQHFSQWMCGLCLCQRNENRSTN